MKPPCYKTVYLRIPTAGEWAVGQSSLFHAQFTGSPPRLQLGESRLNGCLGSIWQGSLRSWDLVQQHVQHAHLPFLGLSQQWLWSTWPPWFDNQQRSPWAQVVYPRPAGEERGKRKGEQNSRGKTRKIWNHKAHLDPHPLGRQASTCPHLECTFDTQPARCVAGDWARYVLHATQELNHWTMNMRLILSQNIQASTMYSAPSQGSHAKVLHNPGSMRTFRWSSWRWNFRLVARQACALPLSDGLSHGRASWFFISIFSQQSN